MESSWALLSPQISKDLEAMVLSSDPFLMAWFSLFSIMLLCVPDRWRSRCTWASLQASPTGAQLEMNSPSSWKITRWWTLWSFPITTQPSFTPTSCVGYFGEPWRW